MNKNSILVLLVVICLGSCTAARHQHRPYKRPKPGKEKPCNCPDFGYIESNADFVLSRS